MVNKIWVLLPLSFLIGFHGFGQETEKKKKLFESADSTIVLGKGRIVYKDRIYRQNASYLTVAYGAGIGSQSQKIEQNMTLSYQHFIKKVGLQIGYLSSSDTKTWWNSDQKLKEFFLGVGHRWEGTRYNFAAFAGPSWVSGSYLWVDTNDKTWVHYFSSVGAHAEIQATYKVSYDIGLGLTLFGSLNQYYSVAGAALHLFFSTAFVRNYN